MRIIGRGWVGSLAGLCILWAAQAVAETGEPQHHAAPHEAQPLNIVTSIRPLALMVRDIAGDAANVDVLLPTGASPHHYSLRVSDMRKVQQADLLVWLGPDFERFLTGVAAARPLQERLDLTGIDGLTWPSSRADAEHADAEHAGRDTHVWLNPDNGRRLMQALAARLSELRPAMAGQFQDNLDQALADLAQSSGHVEERLAPLAEQGFGVSHDGFGHFVARFNLNQLAAVSAMPDQGLSARHMMELVKQMADAQCLLIEEGEAEAATDRLQRLLKVPVVAADPLAVNPKLRSYAEFIDALGSSFEACLTARESLL